MKDNTPQAPARNYTGPFITMVFLFFIVGFLTTANTQFQIPLQQTFLAGVDNLKNTFSTLIIFSWFLAYPICGGTGSRWISRYGYKGTLLLSLLVMIVGLALFYASSLFTVKFPDAALTVGNASIQWGFFIFLAGSFVLGASVTILQVVVNPYLTACTVRGTQPIQRLAIGGSANSVGTTIAPYFVTGVVFAGLPMSEISIDQLMVPFLGLIAVVAVVYASLYFTSLPDIEGTRIDRSEANAATDTNVWRHRHFLLGVVAIFCYVGAEVCIGGSVNVYAEKLGYSETQFVLMVTIYWGLMAHRTPLRLHAVEDFSVVVHMGFPDGLIIALQRGGPHRFYGEHRPGAAPDPEPPIFYGYLPVSLQHPDFHRKTVSLCIPRRQLPPLPGYSRDPDAPGISP